MSGRCHDIKTNGQRALGWPGGTGQTSLLPSCLVAHRFELTARPPNDIGIDPHQRRTQLRLVEVAVVGDPAADARVVHPGQVSQGFVAAVMQRPAANVPADARQRLRTGGELETRSRRAQQPAAIDSLPRSSARHSPQLHRPGEAAIGGSAPTAGVVRRGAGARLRQWIKREDDEPDRAVRNRPAAIDFLPRSSARHSPQLHRPGEAAIGGSAPTAGVVRRGARRAAATMDKERGRLSDPTKRSQTRGKPRQRTSR